MSTILRTAIVASLAIATGATGGVLYTRMTMQTTVSVAHIQACPSILDEASATIDLHEPPQGRILSLSK